MQEKGKHMRHSLLLFLMLSYGSMLAQNEIVNKQNPTRADLQEQIVQTRKQLRELSEHIKLMSNKMKGSRRAKPVAIQKLKRQESSVQQKLKKLESEFGKKIITGQ